MRRYLLTIVTLVVCINVIGRDDVTKLALKIESNNPAMFWYNLGTQHPEIIAMQKAIDQNKPAMQVVANALGDISNLRYKARQAALIDPFYLSIVGQLYKITKIQDAFKNVEFYVISDTEINASMYPDGTCLIFSGLIDNAENLEDIIAVVAHEIAHYILWHTVNDMWRTAKAINRNQKWAEVGTVLAAGAYGASQIYAAQNGVQQSNAAQQQMYNNITSAGLRIREEIGLRTDIFTRLRYMRETEAEADETAFWFLEKNGIDPIFLINFFKIIDAKTPSYLKMQKKNSKFSDHPDMSKRIEAIEIMYKKYHKPMSNQNSLPKLSSFKTNSSLSKEDSNLSTVKNEEGKLYLDKTGTAHFNRNCQSLKYDGYDRTIIIKYLKEEPSFCRCVADDIKREIRINLTTQTSFFASSQQKEKITPKNAGTDNRKLYFDKKGWAHYDRNCFRLEHDELERTVTIGSLTKEPSYCNCVTGDLKREIRINLTTPTSILAPSQQKENTTPINPETEDRKLYLDKKGWTHYDQTCLTLEHNKIDKIVTIGAITKEPSYCKCVTGDIKREISINLTVPAGF